MKWNWGTGIALTLMVFASFMIYMVYRAMQQNFDLVSEDYYTQELHFQNIIDGKNQAASLSEPAKLEWINGEVHFVLPKDLARQPKQLNIWMYHELNAKNDFHVNKPETTENSFLIPIAKLSEGKWKAKVELLCQNKHYYFEPEIVL